MGQQQLLLLVLGIVIVGLAVVVGIQAFSENRIKSRMDVETGMAVQIATEISAWWMKPTAFGGGGQSLNPATTVTMEKLGYPQDETSEIRTGYWDRPNDVFRGIYFGSMDQNPTPVPMVHVHPVEYTAEGAVLVEIAVWGPKPECFARRTAITSGGGRRYEGDLANPNAALCHW